MAESDHLAVLKKLYNDPAYGLQGKTRFIQKVRKTHPEIPKKLVADFVNNQQLQQLNTKQPFKGYFKITAPPKTFQIDLFFLPKYKSTNNGTYIFFIAVDILSRKMFVYPMKSRNKTDIITTVESFVKEHNPQGLESDDEFNMKDLRNMLDKYSLSITTDVSAQDHFSKGNKLGIVDSGVRNIKKAIDNYIIANNTTRYLSDLPKLVANYNDSPHSSLNNKTPDEVYEDEAYQEEMQAKNEEHNNKLEQKIDIQVGDYVRISLGKTKFQKQTITFSPEIYVVSDVNGYKYNVMDSEGNELKRKFKYFELLPVDVEKLSGTKASDVEKQKVVKLDKQVRNIRKENNDDTYEQVTSNITKLNKYERGKYDFREKPTDRKLRSGKVLT